MRTSLATRVSLVIMALAATNCGGDDSHGGVHGGARLPLVTPPVRDAAPASLNVPTSTGTNATAKASSLDVADVKQRFFTAGPTNLYQLLASLDARISDINTRSASSSAPCLSQAPIPFPVDPFGQSYTFYAQCYESLGSAADFVSWGQQAGATYLYIAQGVSHIAARLTPQTGGDGGVPLYAVDAWIGVGYNNAGECGDHSGFDDCSYGAIELHADAVTHRFELIVAGVGFGYCGAHLESDGTEIYALGSLDMGTTCLEPRSACVHASDLSVSSECSESLTHFTSGALGRTTTTGTHTTFGASEYPGGTDNQVRLDGSATDSLAFGPSEPPAGVGEFANGGSATK